MNSYVIYILKVSIGISLFVIPYYLLLRNDSNLRLKRFYLSGGVILSFIFPLLALKPPENIEVLTPAIDPGTLTLSGIAADAAGGFSIHWPTVIFSLYLCGALLLLFRNVFLILKWNAVWSSAKNRIGVIAYSGHDEIFSIFSKIFIPDRLRNTEDEDAVLLHERAHISQMHYIDLLIVEIAMLLTWFNPFTWLLSFMVKENHEHLADRAVLASGIDPTAYRTNLLNQAMGMQVFSLAQQFSNSLTRKRFEMMKRSGSFRSGFIKIAILAPAIMLTLGFTVSKSRQGDTISGKVVFSDTGRPASGASVIIKGTTEGASADKEGNYRLGLKEKATVVFSYVGYKNASYEFNPGEYRFVVLERDIITIGPEQSPVTVITYGPGKAQVKAENTVNTSPQIIIDGKYQENNSFDGINFRNVDSIRTYDKYGKEGGSDLIAIVSKGREFKDSGSHDNKKTQTDKISKNTVFIIDGVEHSYEDFLKLNSSDIERVEVRKGKNLDLKYIQRGKDGMINVTTKKKGQATVPRVSKGSDDTDKKENIAEQVFVVVEEMPRFNGGDPAVEFRKYIAMNLRYPVLAAQKGIAGRVIVQFVVTGEGNVTDARIAAGVDPLLDNEALRVVLSSPAWTPGKQKGKAVKVFYTFPINFVIQESKPEQPVTMEKEEEVFYIVEEMPRFNGGDPAVEFRKFIAENLVYPQEAARDTVSGRVVAQFVVSAEGTVRDVEIKESPSDILKESTIKLIESSPSWTPGKQKGKPVPVMYTFPINYVLQ